QDCASQSQACSERQLMPQCLQIPVAWSTALLRFPPCASAMPAARTSKQGVAKRGGINMALTDPAALSSLKIAFLCAIKKRSSPPRASSGRQGEVLICIGASQGGANFGIEAPVPRTRSSHTSCCKSGCELRGQKGHWIHRVAGVPLIPKFASEGAAKTCELRNR